MRADTFAGHVVAVLSRRARAFQPGPAEPATFPGGLRALARRCGSRGWGGGRAPTPWVEVKRRTDELLTPGHRPPALPDAGGGRRRRGWWYLVAVAACLVAGSTVLALRDLDRPRPPGAVAPAGAMPLPDVSEPALSPRGRLSIVVSCGPQPVRVRRGGEFRLLFLVRSAAPTTAGVTTHIVVGGTPVNLPEYDAALSADFTSTIALSAGTNSLTRVVAVPARIPRGSYDLYTIIRAENEATAVSPSTCGSIEID